MPNLFELAVFAVKFACHILIFVSVLKLRFVLIMVRLVYKFAPTFQVCMNIIAPGWNFKTLDEVPIKVTDFRVETQTLHWC